MSTLKGIVLPVLLALALAVVSGGQSKGTGCPPYLDEKRPGQISRGNWSPPMAKHSTSASGKD